MSLQQATHPRSSSNGVGRRRVDRELGVQQENRPNNNNSSRFQTPRDRLIFTSTCLIGHLVEVHVKNGSIISGIFHATDTEDFGIVLKMARVVKDGSLKGQTITSDISRRPQMLIISGKDVVQVIAKDVLLTGSESSNNPVHEKRQDLMIDSAISQSHRVEERELERWAPDSDDPNCPELDNIFDGRWNRSWDQFQANEELFGVKSTFNEELYTTKLERGPQTMELEREALRIAREIEGEGTDDLHMSEERGANVQEDFDLDEESRFSAVHRIAGDCSSNEDDKTNFEKHDDDSFGGSFNSIEGTLFNGTSEGKIGDHKSPRYLQKDAETHSTEMGKQVSHAVDPETKLIPPMRQMQLMPSKAENDVMDGHVKQNVPEKGESSKLDESRSSSDANTSISSKDSLSFGSEQSPSYVEENKKTTGSHMADSGKTSTSVVPVNSSRQFGNSTSPKLKDEYSKLDSASPGLSPSSALGSLPSEKSTLNPYAKEFKLNPNAKVFKPSSSLKQHSSAAETSVYHGTNSSVPYMHGLPVGVGIGVHQHVYNPPALNIQSPQTYIPSNPQQYMPSMPPMMLGQPRPYVFVPAYPPPQVNMQGSQGMQYIGKEF